MPGGDRTGPAGMGPMTGRGAGYCAGFNMPGVINRGLGFFGWGRRRGGGGRGYRNMFYATGLTGMQRAAMGGVVPPAAAAGAAPTTASEKQVLEAQLGMMQSQMEELKRRLAQLETGNP